MSLAEVDRVIDRLDEIIDTAINERDRIGYFAAMYQKVTQTVRDAIVAGDFDDGDRMARFDAIFADRFIAAYDDHRSGRRPTRSWRVAFDSADERQLLIVQQLLISMNAHINLDLGIAAAQVAPASGIAGLKADFDRINDVLGGLVNSFEEAVASLSPSIGWLTRFGGRTDDEIIKFSITTARHEAWRLATELDAANSRDEAAIIDLRDDVTCLLGKTIRRPGLIRPLLLLIRARESNDVAEVIRQLRDPSPPV